MPSGPSAVAALVDAVRWVAVVIGCVFAADAAVDGSVGSVVAVGIAVLVAVWWTLRPETVDRNQDVVATLALVAAALLAEPIAAFVPAILVSLVVVVVAPRFLEVPEPGVDAAAHVARAMGERTPDEERRELSVRIHREEVQRASRVNERVAEWLTYAHTGLDRHLSRRPDRALAELRNDLTDAIREVEERSRQMRARVTESTPLSAHAGRMLEWWSDHHGGDVTLRITDPEGRLDPATEQGLLTILDEALDNAGRHSQCETLDVLWEVEGNRGLLRVTDDGVGFDLATSGPGLAAMGRAAERVGAQLTVDSTPGAGTTVTARVTEQR